ncbi:hypothetical protein Acy02nite_68400 [Actinoplanes cyaneus]|uniref:Uncharacterized protein n=1 Tax=Actinoplanes cyaneus TaxID=52696 RepID=A0A919MAU9_9ACTN|nr:hypothetical protein [Actinoplanes cyaneus]MCW2139111.1 hypothetical protein [Actinoplanes cyaneus]GID68959.1 hypothetical protein Acy02nite_68400 [Actinoplanes cyaneus]
MSLPPLATVAELQTRVGGTITGPDLNRAVAALEDVSSLVRLEAGTDWVAADGVTITAPRAIVTVVLAAAGRVYRNPDGYQGETVGAYSYQYAQTSTSAYLSTDEITIIRRAASPAASSGVFSLRTPSAYESPTPSEVDLA